MNLQRLVAFSVVVATCFMVFESAMAQFPRLGRRAQAAQNRAPIDPNLPVHLSEDSGTWLISCASFVGDQAEVQAMQLVQELRQKHNLRAYIYSRTFDFGDNFTGLGFDSREGVELEGRTFAKRKKMRAANQRLSEFEEIAVVVGDFPSVEDARAQQILNEIKYMFPESLGLVQPTVTTGGDSYFVQPETADNQRMRVWRTMNKTINQNADKKKGPMGAAFLLANPVLPDEYFAAYQVDGFVLDLNSKSNIKNSLLSNPSHYSVRVAAFQGDSTFELDQITRENQEQNWRLSNGKAITESKLAVAMVKAHVLTVELRRLGIPAYEFHDRAESYVCVGGFDWLKKTNAEGIEVQNPEIVKTIELFKGSVENFPGIQGAVRPKSISDIAATFGGRSRSNKLQKLGVVFDVQPIPVQVPKSSLSISRR